MKAGTDALAREQVRNAKIHLLRVLALKPGNESARELLREIESKEVAAGLAIAPMQAATSPTGFAHPHSSPSHGRGYADEDAGSARDDRQKETAASSVSTGQASLRGGGEAAMTSHMQLALTYRAENKLEKSLEHLLKAKEDGEAANVDVDHYVAEVKTALADQFYREGVRRFRANLDESITAFERALSYDPEHERARHYLSTAVRLRRQREESAPIDKSSGQ